jgi:hypothetical protein
VQPGRVAAERQAAPGTFGGHVTAHDGRAMFAGRETQKALPGAGQSLPIGWRALFRIPRKPRGDEPVDRLAAGSPFWSSPRARGRRRSESSRDNRGTRGCVRSSELCPALTSDRGWRDIPRSGSEPEMRGRLPGPDHEERTVCGVSPCSKGTDLIKQINFS